MLGSGWAINPGNGRSARAVKWLADLRSIVALLSTLAAAVGLTQAAGMGTELHGLQAATGSTLAAVAAGYGEALETERGRAERAEGELVEVRELLWECVRR